MTWIIFSIASLFFSGSIWLRHSWFQTSSWDLGIFDQATYLISKGLAPNSSLLNFHILGDHGSLVLYPIGWLSIIFPTVKLLFFLQGLSLASTVFPLAKIAKKNNLSKKFTITSLLVFLLYPIIFNVAIFDFHPEVLAVPLIMEIILLLSYSNSKYYLRIFLCLLFALTCKITISFLVVGIGLWMIAKKRINIGLSISSFGMIWFILISQVLIPYYGGTEATISRHLSKFGISNIDIFNLSNLLENISILCRQILSIENISYMFLLLIPILYICFYKERKNALSNLFPFTPLFLLNIISSISPMKDLVHQYSLFLVPFIASEVQMSLIYIDNGIKVYPKWFSQRASKIILIWSILTFMILSRVTFFFGPFQDRFDSISARREAISKIDSQSAVLTSNDLIPHLSRRKIIKLTTSDKIDKLDDFDEILLDINHPGWNSSIEINSSIIKKLEDNQMWYKKFEKGSVLLFEKSALQLPIS